MALIKCPECQKEISSRALSCPHCGIPLIDAKKDIEEITTIQETSKSLKEHIVYSVIVIIGGILFFIIGSVTNRQAMIPIGFMLFLIGVIWFIVAKITIWWHHK
jgi:uncharacterized membrane protein YvbJ